MTKIANRHPDCKAVVVNALTKSFPPIEPKVERLVERRARQGHESLGDLTGRRIAFPEEYTETTRTELMTAWSKSD